MTTGSVDLKIKVDFVPGDWRTGADPEITRQKLLADKNHEIKAVLVTHNETSTGIKSRVEEIRKAIDDANHPALFSSCFIYGRYHFFIRFI
jgi:alanine-glyoxylate transaminase/serine-glyoxylate transaminase/serine-pyruvate transaminase